MKAHQIISSHLKLFIWDLHKKIYLNEQIKPLHPVMHAVHYHKVVIVGLSCDITCSITLNLYNRVTGAYHDGVLEIDLILGRGIILNAILETRAAHTHPNHSQMVSTQCARSLRP